MAIVAVIDLGYVSLPLVVEFGSPKKFGRCRITIVAVPMSMDDAQSSGFPR